MSAYNLQPDPQPQELGANVFYTDIAASLGKSPITRSIRKLGSTSDRSEIYTLRRLWLPSEDDLIGRGNATLEEISEEYGRYVSLGKNIGITLLSRSTAHYVRERSRCSDLSEGDMTMVAKEIPGNRTLEVSTADVINPKDAVTKKFFVGVFFGSDAIRDVTQDQAILLFNLDVETRERRRTTASFFSTPSETVADELAEKMRREFTFPGSLTFGEAVPAPVSRLGTLE